MLFCYKVIIVDGGLILALECVRDGIVTPSNLPLRMRKEVVLSILRRSRPRCGEDMRVLVMGAAAGGEGMCRL